MSDVVLSSVLLESGTNEMEFLEFKIDNKTFGINVAKILELLPFEEISPMPKTSDFIEGIIKPRDEIITVVDLAKYLGLNASDSENRDIFIITKINSTTTAFHVHSVEGIQCISWKNIEKPSETIYGEVDGYVTGIAKLKDRLVALLDFEKILAEINPSTNTQYTEKIELPPEKAVLAEEKPILVVEDSPTLQKLIVDSFINAGYKKTYGCSNGAEALELLNSFKDMDGSIDDYVKCVVTDIEMPQLDGHGLTKIIKEDSELSKLPVIIFSSLITDEMKLKGESLGATAQLAKNEIKELISLIDKHSLN